jgi:hypothetical protein
MFPIENRQQISQFLTLKFQKLHRKFPIKIGKLKDKQKQL